MGSEMCIRDRSVSATEAATEFERTRISVGAGLSTGEALQAGLLNEVMGTLARRTLYQAEASRLGITSTRDMQKTAIGRELAFRDELGQFSNIRFRTALAQAGYTEQQYLDRLSYSLLQDQIEGSVTIAGAFPENITARLSAFRLEQRTVTLKQIDVKDQNVAAPSEADLAAFFDREQDNYDAPALRSFEVIYLAPDLIEDRIELEEAELRTACLLYTSPSPRDLSTSRMPSSA